ncbi:DUF4394 domain-containing protein [Rhodovarius crocodyli]|uniref:DUF4394 domain-containing protein n=1 Tax=Rhodovarius crocodyli TaxID=1979269 RepID=A0A437M2W0_9PROT|nr:DUF4394 domain-containing protein [Rhodovarius crocodyli]RVT91895.1 DUF4394 domain-containing protein [Rhodovarius crocodyli]
MTPTLRLALLGAVAMIAAARAEAATLVALTADNKLIRIDSETRRASAPVAIRGASGEVVGIDQRPQDGRLYGITSSGQIVTIDPATGRATRVSQLNVAFQAAGHAIFDFNPVANRVRIMGLDGQNLRVNVETGEAATDGRLRNAEGTAMPRVVAGAYTNSVQGATATQLLTIDPSAGALNLQNPPNDGVQAARGRLSAQLPATVAFDILSDGTANTGYVMAGSTLHGIDLQSGALTPRGEVRLPRGTSVIDIAAMR